MQTCPLFSEKVTIDLGRAFFKPFIKESWHSRKLPDRLLPNKVYKRGYEMPQN
jgi:hypothetical protein